MNVALFASAFYPHVGGVEELVRQLAHEYRRAGLRPIVLTNRWPRNLPEEEQFEGIPLYRLAMRTPEPGWKARVTHALTVHSIREQMLRILRRHGTEVLHVQCVSSNGYYALHARRKLRLPLLVTTQGERTMDATQIYQKSPFLNRVLRSLLDEADHITACSRHTLDDMEQYYGTPFGERASVVYNGIQTTDFQAAQPYAHPRPYILGIGRLVMQKGFDVLIEAFARAKLLSHDLLLAGEGPERAALERCAREHGVEDHVVFLGRADRPLAASLFKGCEFFVLPSRQEPMGIVNLEAMAAGKAVIASRTGGVPELVLDGTTGLLVRPDEPGELTAALMQLAGDGALCRRLGAAGERRAEEQFTWPAIAQQYRDLYARIAPVLPASLVSSQAPTATLSHA